MAPLSEDVKATNERILIVGGVGFGVILLSIAFISSTLTKPMRWMQKVSGMIVDNVGGNHLGQGLLDELDSSDAKPCCSPRTEVTLLLSEFVKMLEGFGGEGASEVSGAHVNECKNTLEWREIYQELYPWGDSVDEEGVGKGGVPRHLSVKKAPLDETFDDELTEATLHTETDKSFFAMLPTTITQPKYSATIGSAFELTTSVLSSVKGYAVNAGIKAGVIQEPPPEEKLEGPPFVNRGENIKHASDEMRDYFEGVEDTNSSYLFWWTTFLVGTPIVVSAILISTAVATDTSENIPIWLADVKLKSIDLELEALLSTTLTRASYVR